MRKYSFKKNFQPQIFLMEIGNQKLPRKSTFGIINDTDPSSLISKILFHFPPFSGRVENKVLRISEISQHFQKCFTGVLGLYKKCVRRQEVAGQLGLSFPGEKWIVWKKVKTLNISGTMLPIFFILSPYVWKNNWLLNKNYWDDLGIKDEDHSQGNF